jgi:integrase
MKFVDPIRKKTDITKMKTVMIENGDMKIALLFVAGINTGLRISDLLKITHEDLQQDSIYIKEQKTGKNRKLTWNNEIKKIYAELDPATGYVFKSDSNRVKYLNKALSKDYVGRTLKAYAIMAGVKGNISTHSLRKTFGYHIYQNSKDVVLVQKLLNHSSQAVTLRYIGIEQEMMDNAVMGLNLA